MVMAFHCRGISLEVSSDAMRKRFRITILAAIIAAVVVPVGFALSRESDTMAIRYRNNAALAASTIVTPVVVPTAKAPGIPFFADLPDGAKLVVVGTVLFGLAAAMRRVA
jgi:hypothetical protein